MNAGDIFTLLLLGLGIVYVVFAPDGLMTEEEYIRTHPEEFRK